MEMYSNICDTNTYWGRLVRLMLHQVQCYIIVILDSCNVINGIQHYNVWLVNYITNVMLECHYNFTMNFQNCPFK